jgi:hypothetical protein
MASHDQQYKGLFKIWRKNTKGWVDKTDLPELWHQHRLSINMYVAATIEFSPTGKQAVQWYV